MIAGASSNAAYLLAELEAARDTIVEPHLKRTGQALSYPDSEAGGFADQLQHRVESEGPDHSL
jgi:hypothetical protein